MTMYKNSVIDADAHVVETERVWDYLEGAEKKVSSDVGAVAG